MAQPTLTGYSVSAGQPIHSGRWPGGRLYGNTLLDGASAVGSFTTTTSVISGGVTLDSIVAAATLQCVTPPAATYALVGDSLTKNGATDVWLNGMAGGKLKRLCNAGWTGDFVAWVLDRIDNNYLTPGAPGLAGLPEALGWVFLRIGTNNFREGGVLTDTTKNDYTALFNKCLNYAQMLVVQAVPPTPGFEADISLVNVWLAAQCAARSDGRMIWMDDYSALVDGTGHQVASYFVSDGVHWSKSGRLAAALGGLSTLQAAIAPYNYPSPLAADPTDVYPSQPQWFVNPTNAGTNVKTGAFAGNIIDGIEINSVPAGFAGTSSIIAADGGDPITAPWQRLTFTSSPASTSSPMIVRSTLAGRTITSSDPDHLRIAMQVRFNGVDPAALNGVDIYIQGLTTNNRPHQIPLNIGGFDLGPVSRTVTFYGYEQRASMTAESAFRLIWEFSAQGVASGTLGSIDFRCINIKG